jgi:ribosomal protein S18 acetylase RimI-like enzyme
MSTIRLAHKTDMHEISAFDQVAQQDQARVVFISKAIEARNCYVSQLDSKIIGYGVLEYSFYSYGFIAMLYVHPNFRRQGIGESLVLHMERECETEKLFTSTNQSNKPMQALLKKLDFQPSGIIENLDPGDPELIYFKFATIQLS